MDLMVHHALAVLTGGSVGPVRIVVHVAVEGLRNVLHPVDDPIGGRRGVGVAVEGADSLSREGIDGGQPARQASRSPGALQLKEGPELVEPLLESSACMTQPLWTKAPDV